MKSSRPTTPQASSPSASESPSRRDLITGFVVLAILFAIVGSCTAHFKGGSSSSPGSCDYDYNHVYLDRGTPYDMGKDAYCKNWKDGQTLLRQANN